MVTLSIVLTVLVTIEHCYILWMEMFAWETVGKRVFSTSLPQELFKPTKRLAANQGLYNGFLVTGLVWSFLIGDAAWAINIRLYFLGCVAIAGIFGAFTASKKIFFMQALPALLAMLFTWLSK